jgi:hypothetical protein
MELEQRELIKKEQEKRKVEDDLIALKGLNGMTFSSIAAKFYVSLLSSIFHSLHLDLHDGE